MAERLTGLQNFRDLCAAAKRARESKDPNSKEHQQYRVFIFDLAITLFHELGHVYITFLSLGGSSTPEELIPQMHGIHARNHPEAGNSLEAMVFGGSLVLAPQNDGDARVSLNISCLTEDFRRSKPLSHHVSCGPNPSHSMFCCCLTVFGLASLLAANPAMPI